MNDFLKKGGGFESQDMDRLLNVREFALLPELLQQWPQVLISQGNNEFISRVKTLIDAPGGEQRVTAFAELQRFLFDNIKAKFRQIITALKISEGMQDYIIANWDEYFPHVNKICLLASQGRESDVQAEKNLLLLRVKANENFVDYEKKVSLPSFIRQAEMVAGSVAEMKLEQIMTNEVYLALKNKFNSLSAQEKELVYKQFRSKGSVNKGLAKLASLLGKS